MSRRRITKNVAGYCCGAIIRRLWLFIGLYKDAIAASLSVRGREKCLGYIGRRYVIQNTVALRIM